MSACLLIAALSSPAPASDPTAGALAEPTAFLQTSAFMLGNLFPEPPSFYQLNFGYRLRPQDALIVELITWTYPAPLGIPYWGGYGDPAFDYPGHVRDWGAGLAWQRLWWRGVTTTLHATPFAHAYYDEAGDHIATGFMLWLSGRAGYHFRFWGERLFVEPAVVFNTWPIQTRQPAGFAAADAPWPDHFLLEPGLHLGVHLW